MITSFRVLQPLSKHLRNMFSDSDKEYFISKKGVTLSTIFMLLCKDLRLFDGAAIQDIHMSPIRRSQERHRFTAVHAGISEVNAKFDSHSLKLCPQVDHTRFRDSLCIKKKLLHFFIEEVLLKPLKTVQAKGWRRWCSIPGEDGLWRAIGIETMPFDVETIIHPINKRVYLKLAPQ